MFIQDSLTIGELKYLYHYTSIDTFNNYIAANGTLRLSPFTKTNDPKETKDWIFALSSNTIINIKRDESSSFFSRQKEITEKIKGKAKLVCFSVDHFDRSIEKDARGFNHPRMWAQYANNHTGVCLIINKEKFDEEIQKQFGGSEIISGNVNYNYHIFNYRLQEAFTVDYSEYKEKGLDYVAMDKISKCSDIYFFCKHPDWSAENEYRYVVVYGASEYIFCSIKNSLEGIVFGVDTDSGCMKEAITKARNVNSQVLFAQMSDILSSFTALPLEI